MARELIDAGRVTVSGAPALNPSRQVRADEPVVVLGNSPRFVSRAGEKLAGAIDVFGLHVAGLRVLDAGASTGGFTDCLLQAGAREVVAVDVGYGQLHERLRTDDRVRAHDRTNVRDLQRGDLGAPFDLVVADLSFISLRAVLANLLSQARPGANLVVLVKPQFEATRAEASQGKGIIRNPEIWRRALTEVADETTRLGGVPLSVSVSPIRGTEGNVEFLLLLKAPDGRPAPKQEPLDIDRLVAEAAALVTR